MKRATSFARLIVALTLFVAAFPLFAQGQTVPQKPFVFAVLGDSIARGTWADTAIGHPNPRFYGDLIRAQLLRSYFQTVKPLWPTKGDPRNNITNLITFIQRDHLSAFVGKQEYSLPVRIQNQLGRKVKVLNGALLAGSYVDGDRLLDVLDKQVRQSKQQPDLIIVHINAVDFVRECTVEQFTQKARIFFHRLASSYPHSNIVVTQLIDIVALVTRENVPTYRLPGSNKMVTCGDMYQQMKFGTLIGLRPGASDAVIAKGYERLNAMRGVLSEETQKMGNGEGTYENFTGKVLLIEDTVAPKDGNFNRILAADCVHPNVEGHRQFGEIIWDHLIESGMLKPSKAH